MQKQQQQQFQQRVGNSVSVTQPQQQPTVSQRKSTSSESNGAAAAKVGSPMAAQPRVPPVILKKMVAIPRTSLGAQVTSTPPSSAAQSPSGPAYTIAVVPQSKLMQQSSSVSSTSISSGPNTIDLTDEEDQTKVQPNQRPKNVSSTNPPALVSLKPTSALPKGLKTNSFPASKIQVAAQQQRLQAQKPNTQFSKCLLNNY